jgi:hypothetical protein
MLVLSKPNNFYTAGSYPGVIPLPTTTTATALRTTLTTTTAKTVSSLEASPAHLKQQKPAN